MEWSGDNVSGLAHGRLSTYLPWGEGGGRITWSQEEREGVITRTTNLGNIWSSQKLAWWWYRPAPHQSMSCVSFNLSKYFSIIKHHHIFRENIIINVWIIFSCQPCGESLSEYLVDVNLVKIWGNYPSFTLSYWGSVYHPLLLSFDPQTPQTRPVTDGRTGVLTWHWGC